MKLILSVFFVLIFIISCSDKTTNPDNDIEQPKNGYTKQIERIYSNEFEKNLITLAESFYPPRDSVLSVTPTEYIPFIPDSNYWFYQSIDGVKIPYAITKEAIIYYSEIIDTLNARQNSLIYKAAFIYRAELTYYSSYIFEGLDPITGLPLQSESFNNVYVVCMDLSWDHFCGPVCGLYIDHKRIVVFDIQGNPIRIFYDGEILIAVS
ncbi:MAG: hypothetical protein R6W68_15465 [Ignavibacteriaceae bacterium]